MLQPPSLPQAPPQPLLPTPITASLVTPPLITPPPDTARESHQSAPSVERMQWALRNLTNANGLNSAVVVACGVPIAELEKEAPKRSAGSAPMVRAAEVKKLPPQRPQLPAGVRSQYEDDDVEEQEVDGGVIKPAGIGLTLWARTGRAV